MAFESPSAPGNKLNRSISQGKVNQVEHEDLAQAKRVLDVDSEGRVKGTPDNPVNVTGNLTVGDVSPTSPAQQIVNIQVSGDQESFIIPARTVSLEMKVRSSDNQVVDFFYAWNAPDIGNGIYKTVECGNGVVLLNVYGTNARTLYLSADGDNTIIEIETFSEI